MSDLVKRHEAVHANARRAQVAPADVVTTLGLLGETVEELKLRVERLEERLREPNPSLPVLDRNLPHRFTDVTQPHICTRCGVSQLEIDARGWVGTCP